MVVFYICVCVQYEKVEIKNKETGNTLKENIHQDLKILITTNYTICIPGK